MNPADRHAAGRTVTPARWDPVRQLAQLVLVACTVLGIAALHSIGHATPDDPGASPAVAAIAPASVPVVPAILAAGDTSDDGCDGDGCTH